ncbi:DUF1120 domain-containing protein [Ralstonia sp. 25C]|uniref:DUF1120 domain-containing protein n=1 Tax=Ralstonia sp. 25C TaxID=3447363 RepID=UPI003F753FF4
MQARSLKLAALAALTLAAATAHAAAPTAELKVKGTLKAPTCTVVAADDGVYDFNSIDPTLIKSGTTHTALTPISKNWTVTCDANTYLTFGVLDNRDASVSTAGVNNFGMGKVNGTGNIGYYTVTFANTTVDSVPSSSFWVNTTSSAGFSDRTSVVLSKGTYLQGWSSGGTQKVGKVFGSTLSVAPYLGGTTTMNGAITDKVDLDGSLTLNYAFGL